MPYLNTGTFFLKITYRADNCQSDRELFYPCENVELSMKFAHSEPLK